MRKLGMIVVLGVAGLAVACGGSSSNGDSGAGGTAGGGGTGAGGTSGGGSSGSCNLPTCLQALVSSGCEPSGSCVTQTDTTTFATNDCYANGVKVISTVNMATAGANATIKNGSMTCMTMSGTFSADGSTSFTMKDASGKTLGTVASDAAGNTTVTCAGGQPQAMDSSCDFMNQTCTPGTCTP